MRADNSGHIVAAAKRRSAAARQRAEAALSQLRRSGEPITVTELCRASAVSRSWLYTQPDLVTHTHPAQARTRRQAAALPHERASLESIRRRLELALQRNRELTDQVKTLQLQLACAHGDRRAAVLAIGDGAEQR